MKTISPLFLVIGLIFVACKKERPMEEKPDIDLRKGLLVYYPFNGSIVDASGNNNNGTVIGGELSYDEHGNYNSAFNATQNGDKIVIPNNGTIKFDTAFSASFHVLARSFGRQNFFSLVDSETGKGATFGIGPNQFDHSNLNFGVTNTSAVCDKFNTVQNTTNNLSQFVLQPESWYNIVCIFNKGELKTFINGQLVSENLGPDTTAHICPNAELIIAGWSDDDETSLNGKIDEVRLYNRVLTADEIAELAKHFQ